MISNSSYGIIENGAIAVTDSTIVWIGKGDLVPELNAKKTAVEKIMTPNPRLAQETDDLIDWLRIMSNERFRRLPVVDSEGQIKAVFTQGDFVSYTWPDLMYQMKSIATATVSKNWATFLIGGGIALYTFCLLYTSPSPRDRG